jgi:hypothetical protein
MINSTLERQAKSMDELLHRMIEERNGKKLDATSVNPSSSTSAVSFTQTNPHTSGASVGWHFHATPLCLVDEPLSQLNHHRGFGSYFWDAAANYDQHVRARDTHTTPSFSMPKHGSITYTSGYNCWAYPKPNGNYQAPYTTVACTNPITLPSSSLGFLPNHAYQNAPCFNAYGQPEAGSFADETPTEFPLGHN